MYFFKRYARRVYIRLRMNNNIYNIPYKNIYNIKKFKKLQHVVTLHILFKFKKKL